MNDSARTACCRTAAGPAALSRTAAALRRAAAALIALAALSPARAQELEVIELEHRLASEVIPIVEPLVESGGVVTGMDNVLFVRTSPANFEQIRAAVAAIDRAPKQLLITVGQGTVTSRDAAGIRGSATLGGGDVQVGVNRPPGTETGVQVTAAGLEQRADLHNVSSVRALEGSETYIAVGQSVPVTSTGVWQSPHGPVVQQTTGHRDVSSGFYATARVSGDRVILEISSRQQRYAPAGGGYVQSSGSTTTVTAQLGEWVQLGAVRESGGSSSGGLLVWGRSSGSSEYSAWVKVEEVR